MKFLSTAIGNVRDYFRRAAVGHFRKILSEELGSQSIRLEHISQQTLDILRTLEERSKSLEVMLVETRTLHAIVEQRSRTIEYVTNQTQFTLNYLADFSQKFYTEYTIASQSLKEKPSFNANRIIHLTSDHPFAYESNDFLTPESTAEGITRPSFFVKNCIEALGQDIKCLDLGVGAGGLVFEWAANGVTCIGVDGSDFCFKYGIGYWPLLKNNLFHCDITKPFTFSNASDENLVQFDIITMWEVFEHIPEKDVAFVMQNIERHLAPQGYFIGSISLLEYTDREGRPYHVTLKQKEWWKERMRENNLEMIDDHPFNESLFCRGNGPRFQDFHNYARHSDEGFLFVAKRLSGTELPTDYV